MELYQYFEVLGQGKNLEVLLSQVHKGAKKFKV